MREEDKVQAKKMSGQGDQEKGPKAGRMREGAKAGRTRAFKEERIKSRVICK